MKMDTREAGALEAAACVDQDIPARVDLYVGIHKALRALMMDVLQAVGCMDTEDEAEFEGVSARVLQLTDFCLSHLKHENEFVHAAMDDRQPGASEVGWHEHMEHGEDVARIRVAVRHMRSAMGEARARAALALYRQLALFLAHNFTHMHMEETRHNAVLWAHYSDEELLALHGRIVASIPPEENLLTMRWMIPALTPEERVQVLSGMKAKAPPQAFAAVLDVVRPRLDFHGWAKLVGGLGLDPVSAAV